MFWEAPVAHLRSRLLQILLPALLSAGLIFTTALNYPLLTLGLVAVSVAMFWAALWSASVLLGHRSARVLAVLALGLGWFAEQMGSSRGWFFGRYTYTDVLGPRLGDVPLAIPLMWLALCLVGYVLASLMLWRTPVHAAPTLKSGALTAWLAALIVTAGAAAAGRGHRGTHTDTSGVDAGRAHHGALGQRGCEDAAGLRIDRAQYADMVVEQLLDPEALAEVGGARLVGDVLGPVVHRPVVGRDVEQFGVRAVRHRHPVGAAEEGR